MDFDMNLALNVIVTGIIVVFLALILLILVMQLMGAVMMRLTGKKQPGKPAAKTQKSSPAPKAPAAPVTASAGVQVEAGIEEEIVAVIMAAVSAMEAESGSASGSFAVRSIRRSREARPAWSVAGLQQNTNPF